MNAQLKAPELLPPGIYPGEPEAIYHRDRLGVLSCSAIKQLLRSPAHYKHWATADLDDESPAQRFGKALHVALLEPERFDRTYVVLPEDAPRRPTSIQRNANKKSDSTIESIEFWDRFDGDGRRVLSADDMAKIRGMQASVAAHPWARLLMQGGQSEVSLRWIDETTGLPCKARADYYREAPKRYVLDVKTCTDASPEGFKKAINNYGYHLQHAHYCDGFRTLGMPLDNFFLLAIESDAPYVCQPYFINAVAEGKGYELRQAGADLLKRCLDAGRYPGYSDDILETGLPPWATKHTNGENAS